MTFGTIFTKPQSIMAKEIITIEDLYQFKKELIQEIKKVVSLSEDKPEKQYLRSSEVRKLLSVSNGTLQNLRNSGLPYSKVNGTIFYRYHDIIDILEKNTVK